MRNFKCMSCGMMKLETNFTNLLVPICNACKPDVKKKKTPKKSKESEK